MYFSAQIRCYTPSVPSSRVEGTGGSTAVAGDVAIADRGVWADVVGISSSDLQRTSLKKHVRRPVRRLPTEEYVGCLRVDVRKSTDFNRQIAGWWRGFVAAVATVEAPSGMV